MLKGRMMSVAMALVASLAGLSARAQVVYELSLDSVVGFPDTVQVGGQLQFGYMVSNLGPLAYQGNVELVMSNAQLGDTVVLAQVSGNGLVFSPGFPATGSVNALVVQGDGLSIGGNVVVVWPRLEPGPSTPPFEVYGAMTRNIEVLPPNSVGESSRPDVRIALQMVSGMATVIVHDKVPVQSISLYDMSGREVFRSNDGRDQFEFRSPVSGIYVLNLRLRDGRTAQRKVYVQ